MTRFHLPTMATFLRWDYILFTATTTAFVAHYYYYHTNYSNNRISDGSSSSKKKSSSLPKRVSFRLDSEVIDSNTSYVNQAIHSSIIEMLPSIDFTKSTIPEADTNHSINNNIQMIGLLFAAQWCPDCTDVVPQVGNVYDVYIQQVQTMSTEQQDHWLQMIYISSDNDEISIQQFKPKSMLHIPYDAITERSRIKQKYSICAGKEMNALQIPKRVSGIPTLLLLNAQTGIIIKENAIDDIMNTRYGSSSSIIVIQQLLKDWKQLLDINPSS